jgi:amidase
VTAAFAPQEIAMPLTPPDAADLAAIAERYGFRPTSQDLESIRGLVPALLASYDVVQRLYSERLPDPPDRSWQRPAAADNEMGAWYVTTSISEVAERPSAGAAPAGAAPAGAAGPVADAAAAPAVALPSLPPHA